MAILIHPKPNQTYADYLTWSRDYGDELIDGVGYVREPPSSVRVHQDLVGELFRQVANALEGAPGRAYIAPFDVRLFQTRGEQDDKINTVVQPDIFIVSDRSKVDERGICGAPDWVAEILSPRTARYDQSIKLAAYERAGVVEVWLIHPTDRTLAVYRLADGSYGRATVFELKGQMPISCVPGVTVDWDRLVAKLE